MLDKTTASGSSVFREIVDNAQVATQAILVLLSKLAPDSLELSAVAWAGSDQEVVRRITASHVDRREGADAASMNVRASPNPCCRAVYLEGKPFSARVGDVADGCLEAHVLRVAADIAGLKYSFICPLKVWNRIEGALSFYAPDEFSDEQRRACETFTRQAALTLENAVLCEVLQVQLEQMQETRRQMTLADERLRREIAELLHSRVQNKLLIAWHQLGQCELLLKDDLPRAEALISEARKMIDEVREREIRQASHRLHPSIIHLGLVPAVRSLVDSFEEHFKVGLDVDPRLIELDSPVEERIPEGLRLAVYRILEEALNNVYRHAGASRVQVTLRVDGRERLILTVGDDGCGFDVASTERGLGLSVIAGRIEESGGLLRIQSTVGQGTTLSAQFPLDDSVTDYVQLDRNP